MNKEEQKTEEPKIDFAELDAITKKVLAYQPVKKRESKRSKEAKK